MVQPAVRWWNIGTDHGQLMVYLAQNGTIRRGYACDINEKPLNKARQIIADYGLEDRIECDCFGTGWSPAGSVDTVVIAGMAGTSQPYSGCRPLGPGISYPAALQPMTKPDHLRSISVGRASGWNWKRSDQRQICLYRVFCGL
ncbi:MAG: tRNA (adenine(22)-N(1))-methyltransferase TrmK [Acutalibacteraceae bacterium]